MCFQNTKKQPVGISCDMTELTLRNLLLTNVKFKSTWYNDYVNSRQFNITKKNKSV